MTFPCTTALYRGGGGGGPPLHSGGQEIAPFRDFANFERGLIGNHWLRWGMMHTHQIRCQNRVGRLTPCARTRWGTRSFQLTELRISNEMDDFHAPISPYIHNATLNKHANTNERRDTRRCVKGMNIHDKTVLVLSLQFHASTVPSSVLNLRHCPFVFCFSTTLDS